MIVKHVCSPWSVEVVWERMGIGELGCTNTLLPSKTAYCYEGCGPESKAWQHCLYNTLFLIKIFLVLAKKWSGLPKPYVAPLNR